MACKGKDLEKKVDALHQGMIDEMNARLFPEGREKFMSDLEDKEYEISFDKGTGKDYSVRVVRENGGTIMAIETIGRDVEKERFTVYLPFDTVKRLRLLAVNQGKRYSKLVNDALLAYFKTEEQD